MLRAIRQPKQNAIPSGSPRVRGSAATPPAATARRQRALQPQQVIFGNDGVLWTPRATLLRDDVQKKQRGVSRTGERGGKAAL